MRNPELNETVTLLINGFVQFQTKAANVDLACQLFTAHKKLARKLSGNIELIHRNAENIVVDYYTVRH